MEQQYPADINAYFKDLVGKAWEKANKRQKIKAKKYDKTKGVGIGNIIDEMKASARNPFGSKPDSKRIMPEEKMAQVDGDLDESVEDKNAKKLEDVRQSNFAYSQTKVAEFISAFFAMLGVGAAVAASEITSGHNSDGQNEIWIYVMQAICNITTLPLILSMIGSKILYVRWQKCRGQYTDLDSIFNTGQIKWILIETFLMLIMPYPCLHNYFYYEEGFFMLLGANDFSAGVAFQWNDFLLAFMIYFRLIYVVRTTLNMSYYVDPRAQRVCAIYGSDANYIFAIKSIMVNDSWFVLAYSMLVTLVSMSYQVRIFERNIDPNWDNITTSMWCMMITMLTIGYGDVYPKSHMGRMMGIVISGWGVFWVSLFVIALTNMLNFNSPELKSFNLLQRLLYKEDLRKEAAGALAATYRLLLVRKQPAISKREEINAMRTYRNHMQDFQKISKQIRNISDPSADFESIKNSIDTVVDDMDIVKMAQYFVYLDSRKLKRRLVNRHKARRKNSDKDEDDD